MNSAQLVGNELRRIRRSRHETLAQVSEGSGISLSYLSGLERGYKSPSLDTLSRLADYYGVTVRDLLAEEARVRRRSPSLPGLADFVKQMNGSLSEDMKSLLVHVNSKARNPATSKEDWMRYYYTLVSILD